MERLEKDITGKFSCKARKFWLNLAKCFQIFDGASWFAAGEAPLLCAPSPFPWILEVIKATLATYG